MAYGGGWDYTNPLSNITFQSPMQKIEVHAVHGRDGAANVQLAPGSSIMLPDDTEKIIWFISTDQYGVKTIVGYPHGDPIENKPTSQDTPVYVTTKEFDELKATVDKLVEELK